jgi:hypothetical protein
VFNTVSTLTASPYTHTLLADTPSFAFFDHFLAARSQIDHLAALNFVSVLPGAGKLSSTAVPYLTVGSDLVVFLWFARLF